MPTVLPTIITRPLRNKVCIFPTEEGCNMTSSDINAIIRRNQYSFHNIFYKPYIKRLEGVKKYNAIRRQFNKYKKNDIIKVDENPGYYIYNIIDNEKDEFTGIVGKIPHYEFMAERVVKVEKSDFQRVEENYNLIKQTGFYANPITVVHEDIDSIDQIIAKYKSRIPLYEFTRTNGFIHEVWQVLDPSELEIIENAFKDSGKFYIIDDNDTFEALHKIYRENADIFQDTHTGMESYNFFSAFLISKSKVNIHEYKKGIPLEYPKNIDEVFKLLQDDFDLEEIDGYDSPEKGEILLYSLAGKYRLTPKSHIDASLPDTVIFEQYILPAISLDSKLLETNSLKYCSGNRSAKCVENQLNKGNCKFGFIIKELNFSDIDLAVKNRVKIPYKSMYIEPRVLRGLFIYEI